MANCAAEINNVVGEACSQCAATYYRSDTINCALLSAINCDTGSQTTIGGDCTVCANTYYLSASATCSLIPNVGDCATQVNNVIGTACS